MTATATGIDTAADNIPAIVSMPDAPVPPGHVVSTTFQTRIPV